MASGKRDWLQCGFNVVSWIFQSLGPFFNRNQDTQTIWCVLGLQVPSLNYCSLLIIALQKKSRSACFSCTSQTKKTQAQLQRYWQIQPHSLLPKGQLSLTCCSISSKFYSTQTPSSVHPSSMLACLLSCAHLHSKPMTNNQQARTTCSTKLLCGEVTSRSIWQLTRYQAGSKRQKEIMPVRSFTSACRIHQVTLKVIFKLKQKCIVHNLVVQ